MHRRRARAEHLHAVHADVALPVARVARDHGRQRDERPGVARPARLHRAAAPRSTSSPRSTTSWQAPRRTVFGRESAIDFSVFSPRTFAREPLRRLHLEHVGELRSPTSSSRSTPNARHMRRSVPNWLISSGMLRCPSGARTAAPGRRLDGAVDDLGHLEVRVDLGARRGRARPRARGARSTRAGRGRPSELSGTAGGVRLRARAVGAAVCRPTAYELAERDHGRKTSPTISIRG